MEVKIFDNVTDIVRDDMEVTISKDSKVSIAAACFSMYAYKELKKQLSKIKKEKNIDFGELKKDLRNIADSMDHALIIERNSLKETTFEALKSENFKIIELNFRPTAENMAKYFYEKIKILGYNMRAVTVYETPANSATYME